MFGLPTKYGGACKIQLWSVILRWPYPLLDTLQSLFGHPEYRIPQYWMRRSTTIGISPCEGWCVLNQPPSEAQTGIAYPIISLLFFLCFFSALQSMSCFSTQTSQCFPGSLAIKLSALLSLCSYIIVDKSNEPSRFSDAYDANLRVALQALKAVPMLQTLQGGPYVVTLLSLSILGADTTLLGCPLQSFAIPCREATLLGQVLSRPINYSIP